MSPARVLILGTVVLVLGTALGYAVRDQSATLEDAQRKEQREFEIDRAAVWRERYEEAKGITDTVIIVREVAAADSIGELLTAYRDSLPQLYTTGDSLRVAMRGWMLAEIRGDRLQAALNKAMVWGRIGWTLADSAAPVIQGLTEALERETKAHQCKTLGIIPGCMSRKTALILGAGGGLVLGALLTR